MIDYNALGQVIDSTWGRSSTPLMSTTSIKMQLAGEGLLKVSYITVVNFRTISELNRVKHDAAQDADRLVKQVLSNVKKNYKELSGESVKLSEQSTGDSVEVIGTAVHNPNKKAFYRRIVFFEVK
jgi:hypothetical protein